MTTGSRASPASTTRYQRFPAHSFTADGKHVTVVKGDTQNAGNVYWFDALIAKGIADPQRNPDHGLSIADHRKGKPDWDVAWFHRYLLAKGDTGKSD